MLKSRNFEAAHISQFLNYQFKCSLGQFLWQSFFSFSKRVFTNGNDVFPNNDSRPQKVPLFDMAYPSVKDVLIA